jgi:hypothetical protein
MIAPVAPPASAPMPVPFSRVLNGCPEHPLTASSITNANATVINLETMDLMIDLPSSESVSAKAEFALFGGLLLLG